MITRAPYPMPDQDVEPPTPPIDVVQREYLQRLEDRDFSEHRIDCHAYPSSVIDNSERPRGGVYPVNAADCSFLVITPAGEERLITRFRVNTVGDYRSAKQHDNPGRDPMKPYGDTPEGEFTLQNIKQNVGGKELYINMRATGGPALYEARRDSIDAIDFHSAAPPFRVTNGCFGASTETLERVVNAIAGTSAGDLADRVSAANERLKQQPVIMTLERDLDKPITTVP